MELGTIDSSPPVISPREPLLPMDLSSTDKPPVKCEERFSPEVMLSPSDARHNHVGKVLLYGVPIVSLHMEGRERLCLAQISNTLLRDYSYNEIHNRRVALGITCVQCTPVQLEILRRAGAMPISSRRCGMITRREAERLVKSFLEDHHPPKLPEHFAFQVCHTCGWGCKGQFVPARYNSSRAKCIKCSYCNTFFSPNKFIFHFHRTNEAKYRHPDAANFNSWRRHLDLDYPITTEELQYAWEDVKAMFNGGSRKRTLESPPPKCSPQLLLDPPCSQAPLKRHRADGGLDGGVPLFHGDNRGPEVVGQFPGLVHGSHGLPTLQPLFPTFAPMPNSLPTSAPSLAPEHSGEIQQTASKFHLMELCRSRAVAPPYMQSLNFMMGYHGGPRINYRPYGAAPTLESPNCISLLGASSGGKGNYIHSSVINEVAARALQSAFRPVGHQFPSYNHQNQPLTSTTSVWPGGVNPPLVAHADRAVMYESTESFAQPRNASCMERFLDGSDVDDSGTSSHSLGGDGDVSRRSGDGDVPRRSGDVDVSRRSGDVDVSRRSGDGDVSSRSGDGDVSRRSGDGDVSRRSGDGDVSSRSGDGDVSSRSGDGHFCLARCQPPVMTRCPSAEGVRRSPSGRVDGQQADMDNLGEISGTITEEMMPVVCGDNNNVDDLIPSSTTHRGEPLVTGRTELAQVEMMTQQELQDTLLRMIADRCEAETKLRQVKERLEKKMYNTEKEKEEFDQLLSHAKAQLQKELSEERKARMTMQRCLQEAEANLQVTNMDTRKNPSK